MIDIHSHFLPHIDDGAENTEESMALLKSAFLQGVTDVAATPHCRLHHENSVENFLIRREKAFKKIQKTDKIPNIKLGAEVLLDHDISIHEDIKKLCIENTDYLLVEFANMGNNVGEEEFDYLYKLTLAGITPIIAHLERYPKSFEIISGTLDLKPIYQINASSFLRFFERKKVLKILNQDAEFIVSSDMHSIDKRPCMMKEAYAVAKKMCPEKAEALFNGNAKRIIL